MQVDKSNEDYGIFDENKEALLDRFDKHAARIMKSYGFNVLAMWEAAKDNKPAFAYLLSWESEKAMNSAREKFMADGEWKEIKIRTAEESGNMVKSITDYKLDPVSFSKAL